MSSNSPVREALRPLCGALLVFLLVVCPAMPRAEDVVRPAAVRMGRADYYYQAALYHYLTGDYLSSSILIADVMDDSLGAATRGADRLTALHRLSSLRRAYPEGRDPSLPRELPDAGGLPEELRLVLLEALYRSGELQALAGLSRGVDRGGVAGYSSGISLYEQKRLGEAGSAMALVRERDRLYPYARISTAQIGVMKNSPEDAEKELGMLLSHPSLAGGELRNNVRLLLAKVLFEQERYDEALLEFMKVPLESRFYRDAMRGMAWCLIKLDTYDTAVPVIQEITTTAEYDSTNWEKELMLGYSYVKLEMERNAKAHFEALLERIRDVQRGVDVLRNDAKARRRYVEYLLAPDRLTLSGDERYYLSMFRAEPALSALVDEHGAVGAVRASLPAREDEMRQMRTYMDNAVTSLERMFRYLDMESGYSKMILMEIGRHSETGWMQSISQENLAFFGGVEQQLYDLWRLNLKRGLNEDEKKVIRLILYEGGEALECYDSLLICTVINMISPEAMGRKSQEELNYVTRVLSTISKDLSRVSRGEPTRTEEMVAVLRGMLADRAEETRTRLRELEAGSMGLRADVLRAEGELEAAIDDIIKRRLAEVRIELSDYRFHAMAGMVSMRGAGGM